MFYFFITGDQPFTGQSNVDIFNNILKGDIDMEKA
jgi:hypothetical protein